MQEITTNPAKSVCIIGNSYVGAVYKAYENHKSEYPDFKIHFYTAAGRDFPLLDIVDNAVVNVKFSNRKEYDNINSYDAYFIYGDMLSPHGVIQLERELTRSAYSKQVIGCTVTDDISSSCTLKIYNKLIKITQAPVYLMSHNILQQTKLYLNNEQYFKALNTLEKILGDNIYHAFPEELFDNTFVPKDIYYSGSVGIDGRSASQVAGHDRYHMNEQGGRLILDSILRKVMAN
ncbi:hypothetical protein [Methylovulum miyakonense]|uniref:hypothetical protein n=1 Tax=Methylovulum miyakonense TaxID=645578 RepID=UPI000363A47A|nr:hypothetical protein [Methylovulum miyakonense]